MVNRRTGEAADEDCLCVRNDGQLSRMPPASTASRRTAAAEAMVREEGK